MNFKWLLLNVQTIYISTSYPTMWSISNLHSGGWTTSLWGNYLSPALSDFGIPIWYAVIFCYYIYGLNLNFIFFKSEPDGFASFHLYVCAALLNKFSQELLQQNDFQVFNRTLFTLVLTINY